MRYEPLLAPWPAEFAGKLPLVELFSSIQGEGRFVGTPAIFIRLNYCNLGCSWCDTRYTWDKTAIESDSLLGPAELARMARAKSSTRENAPPPHVVITGGEPLLHADRLPSLIRELKRESFDFFEVETNGLFAPNDELLELVSWWNCSPKLSNNGLSLAQNRNIDALSKLSRSDKVDFKFVVRDESEVAELLRDFLPYLRHDQIVLMAEGVTARKQLDQMGNLLDICSRYGFRYSPRLHILAWGNTRGR